MRADGGDHDGRHRGMYHTGTGRDGVGRRAGWRADDEAVALDAGHVFAVDEEVDVGEVGRGATIDHDLVQHQEIRGRLGRLAVLVLAHYYAAQTTAQCQGRVTCCDGHG